MNEQLKPHTKGAPAGRVRRSPSISLALNVATWLDVSVRCLGIETHHADALWWRMPGGPEMYDDAANVINPDANRAALEDDLARVEAVWRPNR